MRLGHKRDWDVMGLERHWTGTRKGLGHKREWDTKGKGTQQGMGRHGTGTRKGLGRQGSVNVFPPEGDHKARPIHLIIYFLNSALQHVDASEPSY